MVIQKMMVDRFWQSGISTESQDEFYARISESGSTYEGFASTIRGVPRSIRDWCYHIIYGMTRFEEQFYGLQDLAMPLAEALLSNAPSLSSHHLQRLISLVERLVQRCPAQYRQSFLPPLLMLFFAQVDKKISAEWESIDKAKMQAAQDNELGDEMKAESILRATTYAVVAFASTLLDQKTGSSAAGLRFRMLRLTDLCETETALAENGAASTIASSTNSTRLLILSTPSILEPLILFCTHTLRMHDSRCCTLICRVLRSMIPVFNTDPTTAAETEGQQHHAQVREFISTEVLKAAIVSLNEPYFVDVQRDLATLIANILHLYSPHTPTPRNVILSLPDMNERKVDEYLEKIRELTSERAQRACVLGLLEGVRGVSIHEAGRIDRGRKGGGGGKKKGSQWTSGGNGGMEVEERSKGVIRGGSPGLEGMADMFGTS